MRDRRIKTYDEKQTAQDRRDRQLFAFRRNQTVGLLLFAAAVFIFWLCRTNPAWIFPSGWWRP